MPTLLAKARRAFDTAVLIGVIAVSGTTLWGGDGCAAYQANLQGALRLSPVPGWYADGYITVGDTVLHATVFWAARDVKADKVNPNVMMGTEKGVVTVDGLGTFELISEFVSPHRTFKDGVAILNEFGIIANGTGAFSNASGHFTDHAVYGPGVPGGVPPVNYGFLASMHGNMCGVDLSMYGLTPQSN
jgi:hypothetical protein